MKLAALRKELEEMGFSPRPGKGSHEVWTRPGFGRNVVLYGADGEDAKPYQVSKVRQFRKGMMVYSKGE